MFQSIEWKTQELELALLLTLIQDIIKLKHGRRVSPYGVVAITECLNSLLQDNF
jgi:hypothetical protein